MNKIKARMNKTAARKKVASMRKVANTTDLAKFGTRELSLLKDVLDAWLNGGLPDDFETNGVHPEFNENSGVVFLTNSEYQAAVLVGDKLESWYYLGGTGIEGTLDDLIDEYESGNVEDQYDLEDLKYIFENNGKSALAKKIEDELNEE
jgi:hypothetical protein